MYLYHKPNTWTIIIGELVSMKVKIYVIEITIVQTSTLIFALFVHYFYRRGFVFSKAYFLKVHRRKSFDEEFVSPFNIHIKSCSGTFIILFYLYNLEIDNLNLRSRVCLTFCKLKLFRQKILSNARNVYTFYF